jgi:nitrile hydratase beta subunit
MDGVHDMGGMQGFGPVRRGNEVFHAPWERRAFGLVMSTPIDGNIDDFRHSVERLDPGIYLTAGYYGRWLAALEVRLVERDLISSDDVDARVGSAARPTATPALGLPDRTAPDGSLRTLDRLPRFAAGDAVRAADVHPHGHTRLPRYVRGRPGVVRFVHPAFVLPDSRAHGRGDNPQYVYAVAFSAHELWGEGDHVVHVDIFESHLEQP